MKSQKNANAELRKIKLTIKKKVEDHIDKLNEGVVFTEADFVKVCQLLSKEQYSNITEERSLAEACGSPLCKERIPKPINLKQAYKLTSYHVFKTEERLRFCSDNCFFGSNFVMSQLEDLPVWQVLGKPPKAIKLFSHLSSEDRAYFKLSSAIGFDGKYSQDEIKDLLKTLKSSKKASRKVQPPGETETEASEHKAEIIVDEVTEKIGDVKLDEIPGDEGNVRQKILEGQPGVGGPPEESVSGCEKIRKFVREWSSRVEYHRYCALGRLGVDAEERIGLLSIVDCSNVLSIRRGIVKERLRQAFACLPGGLGVVVVETSVIKLSSELVKYLEFSNVNILLDFKEWEVVALVFLKALSSKDQKIRDVLCTSNYKEAVATLRLTTNQIDSLAHDFLDEETISKLLAAAD